MGDISSPRGWTLRLMSAPVLIGIGINFIAAAKKPEDSSLTNTFRTVFGWIFLIGGVMLGAAVTLLADKQLRPVRNAAGSVLDALSISGS